MTTHDSYDCSDAADRVQPNQWRNPRVVVVDVDKHGQESWGELAAGDFGQVLDTTLVGRVFDAIKPHIRAGKNGGSVLVDGIEYVFVCGRPRTEQGAEHRPDDEQA